MIRRGGSCRKTLTKRRRALQAAEKLNRAVGRGFIPGIKPIESMCALAPEVCFSGSSPEIMPFSAASSARTSNSAKGMRALLAAEKLNRAVGRGFIPGIKPIESMWALAPEVCFSGLSPEIRPFSAASLPCERNKLGSQVDISGVDAARQSPRAGNRAQRNQGDQQCILDHVLTVLAVHQDLELDI